MIFDSPELNALCAKYLNKQPYEIPSIVHLARDARYQGERTYLETLYRDLPLASRHRWFRRFASDNMPQFWGAWFELMLYGWLRPLGNVVFEFDDQQPDFILSLDNNLQILIEAKVILTPQEELLEEKLISKVFVSLREINRPYFVSMISFKVPVTNNFEIKKFKKDIDNWLSTTPKRQYTWVDKFGNEITFSAKHEPSLKHALGGSSTDLRRNIGLIKNALAKKAKQHKKLRENHPYVICLFLHSYSFQPRDVIDAWLGKPVLKVDGQSGETTLATDHTGIHYSGNRIAHTSVSGTLVFVQKYNKTKAMRDLEAHWIENPFVDERIRIDNYVFPAVDRHIVRERNSQDIILGWISNE